MNPHSSDQGPKRPRNTDGIVGKPIKVGLDVVPVAPQSPRYMPKLAAKPAPKASPRSLEPIMKLKPSAQPGLQPVSAKPMHVVKTPPTPFPTTVLKPKPKPNMTVLRPIPVPPPKHVKIFGPKPPARPIPKTVLHTTPLPLTMPNPAPKIVTKPKHEFPQGPLHLQYQHGRAGKTDPAARGPKHQKVVHPLPAEEPPITQLNTEAIPEFNMKAVYGQSELKGLRARKAARVAKTVQANAGIVAEPQIDKAKKPKKGRKLFRISVWALLGTVVIGGLSLFSQVVGETALGVYAIVALWRRWPSQQTFALALMMFVGIIGTSLVSSSDLTVADSFDLVAKNLAVYAFLLLCIGTVSLAREVRRDSK